MSEVKGSKQQRMVVVPYQPARRVLILLLAAGLLVLASVFSYYLGQWQALQEQEQAIVERDQLKLELDTVTQKADATYQQAANLTLAAKVDKASLADVHKQVVGFKQEIAELEESIAFYRGLMSPGEANKKLSFGDVSLTATGVAGNVDYKFVVRQTARNHQVINGSLQVNILGSRYGEERMSVPLYQLSEQVEGESIRLRFKYFQDVTGTIILPEGFEPAQIELIATSTGKKPARAEASVSWQVGNF